MCGGCAPGEGEDHGAALVVVLLLLAVLAGGLSLLLDLEDLDRLSAAADRDTSVAAHAADAALECLIQDVSTAPDWSQLLAGAGVSALDDGATVVVTPWGELLDLAALTAQLQAETDGILAPGANRPRWRLLLHGPLQALLPQPMPGASPYLVGWVADDVAEVDGDPATDANGILVARAMALGPRHVGQRREAVVARPPGALPTRLVSWRAVP